ncbi:MAG: hypothetical protein KKC18_07900 [Chloroflexi bacterium]|nr:hypothetical protein [Chloroflexota bacterium]
MSGIVVALAQGPGIGGPVSDAERAANIRLVKQAPLMFEAIRSAHKLIADGWTEKAQCVLMDAIGAVERGARQ